jgi:hypothetical protein
MQTFLPFPNFKLSAKVLDNKRLGKQRVEVLQLLRGQFPNHPCHKMWSYHKDTLAVYGIRICQEWISRGYKDTCLDKIIAEMSAPVQAVARNDWFLENLETQLLHQLHWYGSTSFHRSHQIALLRKDYFHYAAKMHDIINLPSEEALSTPYVWPEVSTVIDSASITRYVSHYVQGKPVAFDDLYYAKVDRRAYHTTNNLPL